MKKYINILSLAVLVFMGACQDETEVGNLSFPPNVISLTPKDEGRQSIIGGFDVELVAVDGPSSPLASGTLSMKDEAGNVIFEVTEDLSGTRDTILVEGETFDSENLGLGFYTLNYTITDTKGEETTVETTFELVPLPFVANQSEMYVAGAFNGWGSAPMELIGTNTWEVKNIDLAGGEFKLKNRMDWSDTDWGDADCDGTMATPSGNTNCAYTGLVNLQFNDETLKYTITPAVTYATNVAGLYAFGNFNNFQGPPTYSFQLKADHQWELAEIRLKAGDYFKLFENANLSGKNFGDAGYDGQAEAFGSNFVVPGGTEDAFYKIVFNDQTLAYTITLVRLPYPDNLYMMGSAINGWGPWPGAAVMMTKIENGIYEATTTLNNVPDNNTFRFFAQADWNPTSYNYPYFTTVDPIFENAGDGDSNLRYTGTTGTRKVRVNLITKTVTVENAALFITGDNFGWGWNVGQYQELVYNSGTNTFTLTANLTNGSLFRFFPQKDWNPSYNFASFTTVDSDLENQGVGTDQNFRYIGTSGSRTITVNLTTKVVSLD